MKKNLSREGSLAKNTLIITIGKVCTQLVSFFLLPVYTALLSAAEYGVIDLLGTLQVLFLPIFTLQLENAIFRDLIDNRGDDEKIKNSISTAFVSLIVQSFVCMLLFLFVSVFLHNKYQYFLAINVLVCAFSGIALQIARGLGDNKSFAVGSFLSALITVLLNILFIVVFRWGVYGMLSATFIGNLSCFLYILFKDRIYKYIKVKAFAKEILVKMLKYSLPLIPNALSWWVFNSSDRVIVSTFLGLDANGVLAAAYKFSNIYIAVYNTFNMTWTETASLHINDKDAGEFFSGIINISLRFFGALCLVMIAAMPFVYPIMINEKLAAGYFQVPILILSSLFNVFVGLVSVIYIAKKDTVSVAKTSMIAAGINVIVNLALIKFIGLYAASVSTLVAYGVMTLYRALDIKKYIKLKYEKLFLVLLFVLFGVLFVTYYINNLYVNIIALAVSSIFALIANFKFIPFIINFIKKKTGKKPEPIFNTSNIETLPYEAYVGYINETEKLNKSASGGVATAISESFIKDGGVVFGVKYAEDFKSAEYGIAIALEELEAFKTSKYTCTEKRIKINSEYKSVFEVVGEYLNNNSKVLFFGLGCDVGALKSYLKAKDISDEKLFAIDLICYGTPDKKVLRSFVEKIENQYASKLVSFNVKFKKEGWVPPYLRAEFENGDIILEPFYNTEYGNAFNNISRDVCYNCKFKGVNSKGDLTIGDAWGLTSAFDGYNKNGVSLIIPKNVKGENLIKLLETADFTIKKWDMKIAQNGNPALVASRNNILG